MANKNRVIKGKIKKKKSSFGHGYAGNFLRSLGYSARDVITDVMPNAASTIGSVRDTKMELDEALSMATKKAEEMSASAKTKLTEIKENQLKDLIDDIKTGNIYNMSRSSGGGDMFDDFDMGDFGGFDDFDEDFDSGDSSDVNVSMDLDIPEDSPIVESQDLTTATVSKGIDVITKENRTNSLAVASSVAKMSSSLASGMQLLHSEMTKLSTVVPKSLTEHAALSAKYYEDSIGYQKKISESLDELKQLYSESTKLASGTKKGYRESKLDKFLGMDFGGYKDLVKSQAKSTVMDNPLVSMIPMIVEMAQSGMLTGGKTAGQMGLNFIVKTLLGKGIRRSAGKVDNFLDNIFLPIGMKLGKLQDDWSDPIKQFIGNVFGIKATPDLSVDKSKYEKGAVAFDGKVHRAITDVIPTYLRMITSALTGKEEIAFDYEKGVYNTVSNIQKNFEKEIKKSVTNTYFSEKFDFDRVVDKIEGVSKEQGTEIKKAFEDFLFGMAKSNDLVSFRKRDGKDDIAKILDRTSDDPVVRIIREYFEGLYDQGRHSELNDIFGSKSLSAKRNLENVIQNMAKDSTSSNYHLIDNGLYSSGQEIIKKSHEDEENRLREIIKKYGNEKGKGKLAYEKLQKLKEDEQSGNSGTSSTIKPATTGNGIGLDKYNRTSTSYLRDILATLATGIRVVNVGTADNGARAILDHSKKILNSLSLDDSLARSVENAKSGSGSSASVSFDNDKLLEAITSILTEDEPSDDALDWLSKKLKDTNAVGRAVGAVRDKRNRFNRKTDSIANKITGVGIDAIYGKRQRDEEENTDENGGDNERSEVSDEAPSSASTSTAVAVNNQLTRQYGKIADSFISKVITPIQEAFFDDKKGLITQLEEVDIVDAQGKSDAAEATKNIAKKAATGAKNALVGQKNEETGEYENGLLSQEASVAAVAKVNAGQWTHDLVYGTKDGKEKGIVGTIRGFLGEDEDGKLNIAGKAASAKETLKDHLSKRAYEWSELMFGKEEEGDQKKLDIFLGDMKGKKGQIAGAATVGVIGSFFLPGGPVAGAIIGAGLGIAKHSTQLQNVLFGEQDENGERMGGLITKETMNFFQKNGKPMKIGAGVGLIGSFFLPGGPIMGSIIGAGLGIAAKSESMSTLLYGEGGTKEDPTGGITKYIKEHYSKNKDVKATFLDAGIGAGVGLVGSFFLPGGPITGALIGAGANMALNTDRFKNWFFGKEDPEDGNKRKGGVFGEVRDKLTQKVQGLQDDLSLWISENITNPLKASMEPLKKKAKKFLFGDKDKESENKGLIGAIAERVDNSAFGDLKRFVKDHVIDKMKNGFKQLLGGLGHLIGAIIKSPITAIQAMAEDGETEEGKASLAERIKELNAKSKKKMEERKAARKGLFGKKKGETTEDTAEASKETKKAEEATAENTKEMAEATTNTEKIVKEQLETSKEEHEEKVSLLQKILERLPFKKQGTAEDGTSAKATGSSIFSETTLVERIDHNVDKIAKSVDGQLNGVGYNINRIYKLLRKKLKKDGDDDDDDGDDVGGSNKKHFSILDRLKRLNPKNGLKAIKNFGKNVALSLFNGIRTAVSGVVKKFVSIGKSILGIPKMLLSAAKQVIPAIGRGLLEAGKLAGGLIKNVLLDVGTVIQEGAKGLGHLIAGAMSGFGSLLHGLGLVGKEVLTLVGKGIGAVARAGGAIIGSAASAVAKKFGKDKKNKTTRFIIDGGHLDYVTTIGSIGGSSDSGIASSNIINFPGTQSGEAAEGSGMAAFQGGINFGSIKSGIRNKVGSMAARAKGSIGAIKAKFAKEDSEKEQKSWKAKILSLLEKNTEDNKKHHSVWSSIFSKKGLITAGLILAAPLIIKAVKGLISFFSTGIGKSLIDFVKKGISWFGKALEDEGGLPGVVNNAAENIDQVASGLGVTAGSEVVVGDNGETMIDENGNLIKVENAEKKFSVKDLLFKKKPHVDPKTGKVTVERTYDHTTQMIGKAGKYGIQAATHGAKKLAKNMDRVKGVAKSVGTKVASKGKDVISIAKKFLKEALDFVIKKMSGLAKKFGMKGGSGIASKILEKVSKFTSKVFSASKSVFGKFIAKINEILAKNGIAAGTAFISDLVFISIGALSGATNPGYLFEVNMDDIENGKTKALMVAISGVYKGIMGTSAGSWFDLLCDIVYEITGFNAAKLIATTVLNILSGEETENDLAQAQSKFDERYEDAVVEQYNAWKKNQEENGQATMSLDEFKASELALSRSDFNLETNKTLGKKIFEGAKSFGKAAGKTIGKAGKFLLPHKESVYVAPDGTFYRKAADGQGYEYCSPLGDVIQRGITDEEVASLIAKGELKETEMKVSSKLAQKVSELTDAAKGAFTTGWNNVTKGFNIIKEKFTEAAKYGKDLVNKYGVVGAIKKTLTKKKKLGWFDANGGYYVLRDDGSSYDYYNLNGDLVTEEVDKDKVEEMKVKGLLTQGEVIQDSDAQEAIKKLQEKASELWKKAKEAGSSALDKMAEFFGFKKKEPAKTTTAATTVADTQTIINNLDLTKQNNTASTKSTNPMDLSNIVAGKGSDESETTSMSGKANGFAYYSQNDPRFKDQEYDLSNGAGGKMGERGCGPAAMSMVASQLTGQDVDPLTMAKLATQGGYSIDAGTKPEYFNDAASQLGLSSQNMTPSREAIVQMLKSGNPVIIQGRDTREGSPFTGSGHYVVGVGMNGDNIIVNDPRGRQYSKQYAVDDVLAGAQNMWGFNKGSGTHGGSKLNPFAAMGAGVEGDVLNNFPYLLQGDDRWGATPYSAIGDPKQTIASSACGPTSMAMVLRSFGNNVTPIDTANYALNNGYRTQNQGTSWGFFPAIGDKYGLTTLPLGTSSTDAVAELQKGNPVIASMGPNTFTSGGHYIVLSGTTEDGQVLVNDPNKIARSNVPYSPDVFAKEGKQFWSFSKNGKGSINNTAAVDEITESMLTSGGAEAKRNLGNRRELTSTQKKEAMASRNLGNRRELTSTQKAQMEAANSGGSVMEGTPDAGTFVVKEQDQPDSNIDEINNSEDSGGATSILELLSGAVSAFTKPIMEWITGKKSSSKDGVEGGAESGVNSGNTESATGLVSTGGSILGDAISGAVSGANSGTNSGIAADGSISESDVAQRMVEYYTNKGYSKPAVFGIMGNAFAESKLNPASIQGGGKGPAAGLFQWENYNSQSGRWKAMADKAQSKGKDWTDLDNQLEFADMEMADPGSVFWTKGSGLTNAGAVPTTFEDFKKSTDVEMATRQFEGAFERAGKPHMDARIAAAKRFHELYNNYGEKRNLGHHYDAPVAQASVSDRNLGRRMEAPSDPTLVQSAGKGGTSSVTNVSDSPRISSLESTATKHNETRIKLEESTDPLRKVAIELLTRIANSTEGINGGVKDLFNKEIPAQPTQIIDGRTHNNIIPVPQKDQEGSQKDMSQYNTAKRISQGVYLT